MKGLSDFRFITCTACTGNVLIFKHTMAVKAFDIDFKKRLDPSQRLDLHICTVSNA